MALVVDLFCGSFGWSQGWLESGGQAVGFDIEHQPHHGPVPAGAELVLQDVLTLHGSQFKDASLILASPPCQAYSWMAMPWGLAKAKARDYTEHPEKQVQLNALFNSCFRIQREASEAAGRYIPMVVENVKGAQRWVGPAKAHYGSFYLWGDVAMHGNRLVIPGMGFGEGLRAPRRAQKVPGFNFHQHENGLPGGSFQTAAVKNSGGSWFAISNNTESGHGQNPVSCGIKIGDSPGKRFDERPKGIVAAHREGTKGFTPDGQRLGKNVLGRMHGSKSNARKAASAAIARIPTALSRWVAEAYFPRQDAAGKP